MVRVMDDIQDNPADHETIEEIRRPQKMLVGLLFLTAASFAAGTWIAMALLWPWPA
jgi:hypothetical protein